MSRKEGAWGEAETYAYLHEKAHDKLIEIRREEMGTKDLETIYHKYQKLSRKLNKCDTSIKLIRFMRYYLGVECVCPLGYIINTCKECNKI